MGAPESAAPDAGGTKGDRHGVAGWRAIDATTDLWCDRPAGERRRDALCRREAVNMAGFDRIRDGMTKPNEPMVGIFVRRSGDKTQRMRLLSVRPIVFTENGHVVGSLLAELGGTGSVLEHGFAFDGDCIV